MNWSRSPFVAQPSAGTSDLVTPASSWPGGGGTALSVPSAWPSSIHSRSLAFSASDRRGSSTQVNRGVQSASSRASNGGIAPRSIAPMMRLPYSTASAYSVIENGPMPPSWWHDMQCFARIGAASWYQVARGSGPGSDVPSSLVQAAASARATSAKERERMPARLSNPHTGPEGGASWGDSARRPGAAAEKCGVTRQATRQGPSVASPLPGRRTDRRTRGRCGRSRRTP